MRDQSSRLVGEITGDQRELITARLTANMEAGVSPRSAALDIVGRVNRATGRREGGIIGLNSVRIDAVDRAYAELVSGDPALMRNYLTRTLRDRRFDPTVMAALRDGRPVRAEDAAKIAGRYADKHLYRRGEDIARTELLGSLHAAQDEGLAQLVESGRLKDEQITRTWDAQNDSATRDSHRAMDGQRVRGQNSAFLTGHGHQMRFPGDRSLGAPADEVVKCRCRVSVSINFLAELQPGD